MVLLRLVLVAAPARNKPASLSHGGLSGPGCAALSVALRLALPDSEAACWAGKVADGPRLGCCRGPELAAGIAVWQPEQA